MHTKADFAFELPPAQIAQAPAPTRDGSRLLVVGEPLLDARFPALIDHLPPDPVVIVNDARVVPARVHGHRPSGGAAEVLFVEPADADAAVPPGHVGWRCLVRAGGKLHPGDPLPLPPYIARAPESTPTPSAIRPCSRARPARWRRPPQGCTSRPSCAARSSRRGTSSPTSRCTWGQAPFAR
jgi:hypothetical protein